jgi:hypothetical protein
MLILVCIREEHASSKIFLHLKFEEIVHWCYMPLFLKKRIETINITYFEDIAARCMMAQ